MHFNAFFSYYLLGDFMLLKRSIKKIILASFALFLILLVYIMPSQNNNPNVDTILEYVNKDLKTHEIFLLDKNNYLSKTTIIVNSDNFSSLANELINDLIIGNKNEDKLPSGFKAFINENTKINNIEIIDNTIKIDFNEYILNVPKHLEEKVIEAIVYNLTSIENIDNVLIYINGKILNYLPQNKITLPNTLTRKFGINKEYNLTSTKNIDKTTIYYLSNFNDEIYYTPITKVSNTNNNNKIEIIVNELINNKTNNNLISYINYNTKLINAKIEDNKCVLNFNEYIFDDQENLIILDEVLNEISLSLYDNYLINEVIFEVDGKEITKKTFKSIE